MADPFETSNAAFYEPETVITGSYFAWRRQVDVSDDDYSVGYRLTPTAGGTTLTLTGSLSDTGVWLFEALSAATATWAAGEYRWDLIVTRTADSEVIILGTGTLRVFASSDDRRTHAEVMVAKIESLLAGRADSDVDSYTIKNRSISKMTVTELTQWRDYYRAEVARTGGSSGATKNNTVRVRWI
jgi:hypothetical protein